MAARMLATPALSTLRVPLTLAVPVLVAACAGDPASAPPVRQDVPTAETPPPGSDGGARSSDHPDARAPDDASAAPPVAPMPDYDCEALVEIEQLRPTSCAVTDPVSHRVGRLRWVCAGGAAQLALGGLVLHGTVIGDAVELAACRDDPVSWLDGHYEAVSLSADLTARRGALTYARASGLACPRVFTDCSATAGAALLE